MTNKVIDYTIREDNSDTLEIQPVDMFTRDKIIKM